MVDVEIERLAIAGEIDLVREVVKGDEVERVTDSGAAHRRADLYDCVRLALAGRVDAYGRGARFRIRFDDDAFELHQKRPGRVPRLRPIAESCACLVWRLRGEVAHLGKWPRSLFEIGNNFSGPDRSETILSGSKAPLPAIAPQQAPERRQWG